DGRESLVVQDDQRLEPRCLEGLKEKPTKGKPQNLCMVCAQADFKMFEHKVLMRLPKIKTKHLSWACGGSMCAKCVLDRIRLTKHYYKIQFCLPDGSSFTNRFPSDAPLEEARPFVAQFRILLKPKGVIFSQKEPESGQLRSSPVGINTVLKFLGRPLERPNDSRKDIKLTSSKRCFCLSFTCSHPSQHMTKLLTCIWECKEARLLERSIQIRFLTLHLPSHKEIHETRCACACPLCQQSQHRLSSLRSPQGTAPFNAVVGQEGSSSSTVSRIVSISENRVGKPAQGELQPSVGSLHISWDPWGLGFGPVRTEAQRDDPLLLLPVLLIVGHPELDSVTKCPEAKVCIAVKQPNQVRILPASTILEGLGQVPVVQCDHGSDVPSQQAINQPVVIINTKCIDRIGSPSWEDPRPGEREAIGIYLQRHKHIQISIQLVIAVTGYVSGGIALHRIPWCVGEVVPDAGALALIIPAAFYLLTLEHLIDVLVEVVYSQGVIKEIFTFPCGHAIPSQVDGNFSSRIFQGYEPQKPPYTPGHDTNPRGGGLRPFRVHVLGEASNGVIAGATGTLWGLADEHDAHLPLLLWAVVAVVPVPSSGMGLQDHVSHLVSEEERIRSYKDGRYLKRGQSWVRDAWWVLASAIACVAHHPWLMEGDPQLDTVPKSGEAEVGVVQEGIHHTFIQPAAMILQGLRQVPVEQRGHGLNVGVQQPVDQLVVVGHTSEAGAVSVPTREDAGPGDRELIDLSPEATKQGDIRVHLVVTVTGHLRCRLAFGGIPVPKLVPDTCPSSVLGPASFHIEGSCGDAPQEAFRKNIRQEKIPCCPGLVCKCLPDSLIGRAHLRGACCGLRVLPLASL
ncbi:hypothetical protein J0S82_011404, partial [Galemys pyrenaicus]